MGYNRRTEKNAEILWDIFEVYGRTGVSPTELLDESDLTQNQINNAVRYIKDLLQEAEGQPLHYDPDVNKWYLTERSELLSSKRYEDWRMRRNYTEFKRFEHYLAAKEMKFGKSKRLTRLQKDVARVVEDLEFIMND